MKSVKLPYSSATKSVVPGKLATDVSGQAVLLLVYHSSYRKVCGFLVGKQQTDWHCAETDYLPHPLHSATHRKSKESFARRQFQHSTSPQVGSFWRHGFHRLSAPSSSMSQDFGNWIPTETSKCKRCLQRVSVSPSTRRPY